MADEADYAAVIEQRDRENAIAAARTSKKLEATGFCLWCGEQVQFPEEVIGEGEQPEFEVDPEGRRFCDKHCAEDFERRAG